MEITVRVVDPQGQPVPAARVVGLTANGTTLEGTTDNEGDFTFTESFPDNNRHIFVADPERPGGVGLRSASDLATIVNVRVGEVGATGSTIGGGWVQIPNLGSVNPIHDSHGRFYMHGKNLSFNGSFSQPFVFEIGKPFEVVNAEGTRMKLCVQAALGRTFLIDYTPS